MDISDTATIREEEERARALAMRRPSAPCATGFCLFCDEPVEAGRRWCDADCRDLWEREHP